MVSIGITLSLSETHGGRVIVYYNEEPGTICDSNWNDNDAKVICRQMGYLDGEAYTMSRDLQDSGKIWIAYPRCTGNEEAIWNCVGFQWNVTSSSCRRYGRYAAVKCSGYGKNSCCHLATILIQLV